MRELTVKYNELSAEEFISLWETVWGQGPTLEQTRLAMPDKIPFYEKFGFDANEAQRLKIMHRVK